MPGLWVFLLVACFIPDCRLSVMDGISTRTSGFSAAGKMHSLLVQLRKECGSESAAERAVQKSAF